MGKEQDEVSLAKLRKKAETCLAELSEEQLDGVPEQKRALIQELRTHQIELELQNEELRNSEAELSAARDHYAKLYDYSPTGHLTLNDKLIIEEANLTFASMLEMDVEQLLSAKFSDFICKEDQDNFYRYHKDLLASGGQGSTELRLNKKDGSKFWIRIETNPDENSGHASDRFLVSISNVSEQKEIAKKKKVEEKLRIQQKYSVLLEKDRALFDAMSRAQSQFITDTDPRDIFDHLLVELLQMTESEYGFIGQIFHDDDNQPYLKTFALTNIAWNAETLEFYKQSAPTGMEFRNLNSLFGAVMTSEKIVISNDPANDPRSCGIPKGHPPLKAFLGIPFIIGDKLIGMAGIANCPDGYNQNTVKFLKPLTLACSQMINAFKQDIARKQAEEQMESSEHRLSGILDSAAEAVISIDESQHIILFNKGAEEVFGYRHSEILGQPLEVLLPGSSRPTHRGKVANFGKSQERSRYMAVRGEIEGQRKNGEIFPAEASISKIELNGKKTFTAVLRDVSERKESEKVLRDSFVESIDTLMRAAEYRDDETGAHVRRISYYTRVLAEKMGMDEDFCHEIFYASAMHDIGKIGTPDHILLKPGGFTPEEWEIMKTHTIIGGRILAGNSSPYLQMGEEIALAHHERWDGGGYPFGLKGEAIPVAARIMQLADVYDALRSERPYKKAFDHAKSLEIITQGDGRTEPSHFDPDVLAAFVSCAETMSEIFEARKAVEGQ